MIERLLMAAILAASLAGLYITSGELTEAEREAQRYCEMVQQWHDTGGEYGWPSYRDDVDC